MKLDKKSFLRSGSWTAFISVVILFAWSVYQHAPSEALTYLAMGIAIGLPFLVTGRSVVDFQIVRSIADVFAKRSPAGALLDAAEDDKPQPKP